MRRDGTRASDLRRRYGPWALVAGASDGIGAAFATALAARGLDVVLVARREQPLTQLGARLRGDHGVRSRVIVADLATPDGVADVLRSTEDIGLVVANAALAPIGPFARLTPAEVDAMVDLNCRAAARLAHHFGAAMLERGRGGVILLSSLAGYQGSALTAHYCATKAYLRVLAEGLWYEWRPAGVHVLACCPGLVATPTYARDHPTPGRLVPGPMNPDAVARQALAALGRRPVVVPGWRNRVAGGLARALPTRVAVAAVSRQVAAMYRLTGGRRG